MAADQLLDTAPPPPGPLGADGTAAPPGSVGTADDRFRLRDLDGRGRLLLALLALALMAAPLRAAIVELPRWSPGGDDVLIELRARDTGTSRTPLVGQPSTSGAYGTDAANVAHPGPAGLYVLVPGVRLLGPTVGILFTTMLVTAASVLVAAWVIFRQAGPRAAAAGAVLLASAMWTAGGAGILDPLSSNFGRFALLGAAALVWALVCGDIRLLPLAVVLWSFAVQQHLSVVPAGAVLAVVGLGAVVAIVVRARGSGRPAVLRVLRWVAGGAAVGLVLWAPVIREELRPDRGNLTLLATYSEDPARVDLGYSSALGQVVRVGGLPPFVGRSSVAGWDLVEPPGPVAVVGAGMIAVVLVAGAWWARRRDPRLTGLVVSVFALGVAGVVTGANIPNSPEQGRLNFYHWAFAMSVLELLALGWLVALAARVGRSRVDSGGTGSRSPIPSTARSGAVPLAVATALVVVAAVVPLGLDREVDRLLQTVRRDVVEDFVAQIEDDPALARDGPLLVVVLGNDASVLVDDEVRVRLRADGYDVRFGPDARGYVHPDHRLNPCAASRALVIGLWSDSADAGLGGRRVAEVEVAPELDVEALDRLAEQARGQDVDLGGDLEATLVSRPGGEGGLLASRLIFTLGKAPEGILVKRDYLDLLIDHPLAAPRLDRSDLVALRDSFPDGVMSVPFTRLTADLVDRDQLRALRPDLTAGCP